MYCEEGITSFVNERASQQRPGLADRPRKRPVRFGLRAVVSLEQSCLGPGTDQHVADPRTRRVYRGNCPVDTRRMTVSLLQPWAERWAKRRTPAELNQAGLVGSRRTRLLFSSRIVRSALIRKGPIDLLDE
jgi:hypothetical protein